VAGRVLFAPRLEFSDYLSLLVAADVLLDPIHYGGGLTMHDALSLNRPVVTLPGEFARGRYAAGLYEKMEVTTLVADSPQHYAELAVQLANEPDLRQSIETTLRERSSQLFEDSTVVAQYQQLFERLVVQARET
jgi:predicted O-linked N-acetylglucosamine transferase (SPINDLY family)